MEKSFSSGENIIDMFVFFQVVSAQESGNAAVAAAVSVAAGLPTSSPSMYCSSMNSAEAMGKIHY